MYGGDDREGWILGIDEAGRGPVLGPMVYGCCFCKLKDKEKIANMGFADSKQLKEDVRIQLFKDIKNSSELGWLVDVISPEEISNTMLGKNRKSLNVISHDSAIGLIHRVMDSGKNVKECYLDAVGPDHTYLTKLNNIFAGCDIKFVVESKADDTYPIVSAASICAKNTRDDIIESWKFRESKKYPSKLGCGYPGDEDTKSFLQASFDPVFGFPSIARFSWSTASTIIEERGYEAKWSDTISKNALTSFGFGKKKNSTKCPYFIENKMEPAGKDVFAF